MGLAASHDCERSVSYQRHRPEATALYELVRDNLATLYGAIDDGALDVRLPKHAKKGRAAAAHSYFTVGVPACEVPCRPRSYP
jgi:hypothetical protein